MSSTTVRRLLLLVSLATAVLVPGVSSAAHADAVRSPVVTTEQGCTEIAFYRGGNLTAVAARLPAGFVPESLPGFTDRAWLLVNEVHCDDVTVAGAPPGLQHRPTTTVIVSVFVDRADGAPLADDAYVLDYATSNPAVRSRFQQQGWPSTPLSPRSAITTTTSDGVTTVHVSVLGAHWTHTLTATTDQPTPPPTSSDAGYTRVVGGRQLVLRFHNLASTIGVLVNGDLRDTPLSDVTFLPPLLAPAGGFLVQGGWTAELSAVPSS